MVADHNEVPICGCYNLSRHEVVEYFSNNNARFDQFIRETGAGSDCTACMLDLELLASEAGASSIERASTPGIKNDGPQYPYTKRWKWIDQYSPMSPYNFKGVLPLFLSDKFSQWVTIANQGLDFNEEVMAPDLNLTLTLLDAEGDEIYQHQDKVVGPKEFWLDLSAKIPKSNKVSSLQTTPQIGSLIIDYSFVQVGYRGATRPNTVIKFDGGAACVHSQTFSRGASTSYGRFAVMPNNVEYFLSVISGTQQNVSVAIKLYSEDQDLISESSATILPRGARLLRLEQPQSIEGSFFTLVGEFDGPVRAHLIASDIGFNSFSIDHV